MRRQDRKPPFKGTDTNSVEDGARKVEDGQEVPQIESENPARTKIRRSVRRQTPAAQKIETCKIGQLRKTKEARERAENYKASQLDFWWSRSRCEKGVTTVGHDRLRRTAEARRKKGLRAQEASERSEVIKFGQHIVGHDHLRRASAARRKVC